MGRKQTNQWRVVPGFSDLCQLKPDAGEKRRLFRPSLRVKFSQDIDLFTQETGLDLPAWKYAGKNKDLYAK